MFCGKCGKDISDDALFCKFCGVSTTTTGSNISVVTEQPKKKGKAGLIIGIIASVIILIGGGLAAVFLLMGNPVEKVEKALDEGDVVQAMEYYDKLSSNKDKDKAEDLILAYTEEIEDEFMNEDLDYDSAISELERIAKTLDDNRVLEKRIDKVNKTNSLREEPLKVIGKWAYEMDLQDMIVEETFGEDFADFKSTLPITLYFDFQDGSKLELTVDEDAFLDAYDNWLDDFCSFAADYLYRIAADSGMTKSEVDSMFGGNAEDYFRDAMNEEIDPKDLVKEMKNSGVWEVKDGKLYISEGDEIEANSYDNYKIDGDTMTITLPEGATQEELIPGMEYPLTLKKVN